MRPELAKMLVCPLCLSKLGLEVSSRQAEEILAGTLRCGTCSQDYPIRGGIPRFAAGAGYTSSFSFEWRHWRRTQFDTESRKTSQSTFEASTGWRPENLDGKLVLDAGCGAGRHMDLVARAGSQVVGVDLSQAIEVAQENLGHLPNCHFVQADLLRLPFPRATFDYIYSIGVLHHTPDTRKGFLGLVGLVKPGGEMAVWVYPRQRLAETFDYFPGRVNEVLSHDVHYRLTPRAQKLVRPFARQLDWIMETSSTLQRLLTARLPAPWLYRLCHVAIPLYYLYRIPLFYPLRLMTKIAMDPDPEWRVLDTFDWYSPKYQWKHTFREVCGWFEEAGFGQIAILPRPVAVCGVKRPEPASVSTSHLHGTRGR